MSCWVTDVNTVDTKRDLYLDLSNSIGPIDRDPREK